MFEMNRYHDSVDIYFPYQLMATVPIGPHGRVVLSAAMLEFGRDLEQAVLFKQTPMAMTVLVMSLNTLYV